MSDNGNIPRLGTNTGQAPEIWPREAKPDILLTNFMMLELLMTRQNAFDRAVIANCHGLDFLVLDELHTYRGRPGRRRGHARAPCARPALS